MFRFAYPDILYLLLLVPLLAFVYWLASRNARLRLRRFGNPVLLRSLVPNYSAHRRWVKFVLTLLALVLLVVMLARPQTGLREVEETKKGIEVTFLLDVSQSMLAQDVSPNRLERAKLLVSQLIDHLPNDRIALGIFAGEAYPLLPMTSDHSAAKIYLETLSTDMVTLQGTNLASAINVGVSSFSEKKEGGRALVIITDAEDHEVGAEEAVRKARKSGINIYVLGIGTTEGTSIPTVNGPLRDENNGEVKTALNEKLAQSLASAGKGRYIPVDQSSNAREQLEIALRSLKQATTTSTYEEYAEQFVLFGLLALFFLFVEFSLSETRSTWIDKFQLFERSSRVPQDK